MPLGARMTRHINKGYVCMYVCMYGPGPLDRTIFVLGISNLSDLPVTEHNGLRRFAVDVTV